ncbi:MAG TPA: DUF4038 domain-containing protein [Sedimentisphaerales bacterium]|nr:DUF4038 domain-containing protein [Sedimentisphaerales bacterium]
MKKEHSILLLAVTIAFALSICAGGRAFAGLKKDGAKASVERNCVKEIRFRSSVTYADPYNDVTLDVIFDGPNGVSLRVPAFWAGKNVWAVRFAGEQPGDYTFKSVCSNPDDKGLHDRTGTVKVRPYTGPNRLFQHGRLRVAGDKRHFVHADGADFFWIGDTWWMGLTKRLGWPRGFKSLTADRVKKGFNLIQIVAGPLPDMDSWDPRGKNEGGFPFEEGFARINPAFYDYADPKIKHLLDSELMPCMVGMWGYHLPRIGVEGVKRYWRYIVARYGAYPVVWCIAGEGTMPYYLSQTKQQDKEIQRKGWCEVTSYVRQIDPYHNLLSIHPATTARDMSEDAGLFDFEMLQTGHSCYDSLGPTVSAVSNAVARKPRMPVVNSEVNYEGIRGQCWQDVVRLSFYISVFNGTAGHTYGANGIWQFNEKDKPYGPSPHGRSWGNMPWQEAAQLPGGRQVALGGRFIMRFPWWQLDNHPEWVEQKSEQTDRRAIRCMGIPRRLRLIYVPLLWTPPTIKGIERDVQYRAYYFDPCTGTRYDLGRVTADENGNWQPATPPPEAHDWIIMLEATGT